MVAHESLVVCAGEVKKKREKCSVVGALKIVRSLNEASSRLTPMLLARKKSNRFAVSGLRYFRSEVFSHANA